MPAVQMRLGIRFSGRVQGVGFRASSQWIAREFPVSGWVRNEPDGSVWMEAQGDPGEVERFVSAVRDRLARGITGFDSRPLDPVDDETGFEIRR